MSKREGEREKDKLMNNIFDGIYEIDWNLEFLMRKIRQNNNLFIFLIIRWFKIIIIFCSLTFFYTYMQHRS